MNIQYALRLLSLCTLTLLFSNIEAMARRGAIIFVKLEGVVKVQKTSDQQFLPAADIVVGTTITDGHTVITEDQSKAILVFSNGSMTTLESNSTLTIEAFDQKAFKPTEQTIEELPAEPSSSQTKLKLEKGNLYFKVKTLAATSSYEIDSPIGSAGIRGTGGEMEVQINPDGSASGGVNMLEGDVEFTDPSGNTVNVGAGQSTNVNIDANGNQVGNTETNELNQQQTDDLQNQDNEASDSTSTTTLKSVDNAYKSVNPDKPVNLQEIHDSTDELGEDNTQQVIQESATIINQIFQNATINGDPIPEERLFDRNRLFTNEFTVKMIGTAATFSGNADIGAAITSSINAGSLNEDNSFIGNLTEVLSSGNNLGILGSRDKDIGNLFNLTTDDFEAYLGNDVTIDTDRFFYYEYDQTPREIDSSNKIYVTDTSAYPGYWNQQQFISFETGEPIEYQYDDETQTYYDPATQRTFTEADMQLYQENKIVDLSERSTKVFAIAGGDDLHIASDVTFSSRASTWDKEVLAVGAADDLTVAAGKTIEYLGKYLGLGAKSTVNLVSVTVKSQSGIGVGSLNDVVIQDGHFETNFGVGIFADNLIDIDGLTFGGDLSYIYMEARTINLKSINFPMGSEVDLLSEYGPINGKYPNFGSSMPGRVNFISDVSYGGVENVMHDEATFDAFGSEINIRKF